MVMKYIISAEIFERFPEYRRGVVIAQDISNGESPPDLIHHLRTAEAVLCTELTPEKLISHPRIEAWREAYRAVGIKPSDYRPSVEALARRVLRRDPLPGINRIVDLGNLVSIRHLVPIGAHAIDVLTQDIFLRLASGEEIFEPFGAEVLEHPQPGEVIFVEGNTVLTRRWTWRQAKHTLVTHATKAVEINVDCLPPLTEQNVHQICSELAELVAAYCGGKTRIEVLSRENPRINLF